MVDAKGVSRLARQGKRVGVRLCGDTGTNKPKQSARALQRDERSQRRGQDMASLSVRVQTRSVQWPGNR